MIITKKQLTSKIGWILIAVFLSFSWLSACAARSHEPPITLPLAIQNQGNKVETEFLISEEGKYAFNLSFRYKEGDQADKSRVEKLVGSAQLGGDGNPTEPGIPTPLNLKVVQLDDPLTDGEHIVLDMSGEIFRLISHGSAYRKEISRISLMPGHYRATITSMRDIPALEKTIVEFEIKRYFRK